MKNNMVKRTLAGVTAVLCMAGYMPAAVASANDDTTSGVGVTGTQADIKSAVWDWADDLSEATVTFTYSDGAVFSETVKTTSEVTKEATYTETGTIVYTASYDVDGTTFSETTEVEIPMLDRITHYDALKPTCIDAGHIECWYDNVTNKAYKDEAMTEEITSLFEWAVPALGHEFGEPKWTWNDDYTSATLTITCGRCNEIFNETTSYITTERVEPTFEEEGSIIYTALAMIDGESFTDVKTVPIEKLEKITHYDAVEPTCTNAGHIEYWYDNENNKAYKDEALTEEITSLTEIAVPALGHEFGEPKWTWSDDYTSATLTITCGRCNETFNETTSYITTERVEPTFEEEGSITYTALAMIDGESFTDTKTVPIEKLDKIVHYDATEPTCTAAGNVEYWLDMENSKVYLDEALTQEATSLLELVIPALGHEFGEPEWTWADDNSTAHVTVTCTRCGEKIVDADAKITTKRVEPTTEKVGSVTYTAVVSAKGETYIDTKVEILDKLEVVTLPEVSFEKGDNAVKLTWTAVEGAEKYAICGYVNKTWTILAKGYNTSYVLENLKTGYNYKVAVIPMLNGAWKKDFSNAITVTPNASKVPAVSFEKGNNSVKLTWTEVEGAEKYGICGYSGGKWRLLKEGDTTSYVMSDLKTGSDYNVAVIVKMNGKWVTDYSNAITVTPKGSAVPAISFEKGKNSVKLTWNEVEDAEKYAVLGYVSGKWTKLAEGDKTTYVMNNLKTGSEYKIAVIAKINGKWNNDVSNATVVTPKEARVPEYPVVKGQAYKDKFRLQWTAVEGATKYALAVQQAGKWVPKEQFDADVTEYTSPSMKKGDYKLVIIAKVDGKWETADADNRAVTVSIF